MSLTALLGVAKIAVPVLLLAGGMGVMYVQGLKLDVMTARAEMFRVERDDAVGAAREQIQANADLRVQFARSDEQRASLEREQVDNRADFDARVVELTLRTKEIADEALENSRASSSRADDWLDDIMCRLWAIAPEGDIDYCPRAADHPASEGGGAQDATANNARGGEIRRRNLIVTINPSYAEIMSEECDESRVDEEGEVDQGRAGDPRFCNWYTIGFAGDTWQAFQIYMERVVNRVEAVYRWGRYQRDLTRSIYLAQESRREEIADER